jgi:hypothetical protein
MSPLKWEKAHGGHVTGFCDWVCFPSDLAEQFAGRAGWEFSAVQAWAASIRRNWQAQGKVPADRPYDFWNFRWQEQHGSSKPAATAVKSLRERVAERFGEAAS